MSFNFQDIAGYPGKKVDVYVYDPNRSSATPLSEDTDPKSKLRGAQSLELTDEQSEEQIPELGEEATKAIYGPASYGASITMMMRDLAQIAKLAGRSTGASRLIVSEFQKVNIIAHYRDPQSDDVNFSRYAGGFQARTNNKSDAAAGNSETTLEGSCELNAEFDGAGEVVQHEGDGATLEFNLPSGTAEGDIVIVENPAGSLVDDADWSYGSDSVVFSTEPLDGSVIRLVHVNVQTSNIV